MTWIAFLHFLQALQFVLSVLFWGSALCMVPAFVCDVGDAICSLFRNRS